MTERWTFSQVRARRIQRHRLGPRPPAAAGDVVSAMAGAQAQVMSAAELSIALRMNGFTTQAVRSALWDSRELVKTYGPRATVHLLPAAELPMWTGALSAIRSGQAATAGAGTSPRAPLLTAGQIDDVVAAIAGALAAGDPLSADELGHSVVAAAGPWSADPVVPAFGGSWPRWRAAVAVAAARGALCFGPPRGRVVTYTAPERLWPGFRPAAGPGALRELVLGYLAAYGPATAGHFARWSGAPPAWSAALFHSLVDDLVAVDVDVGGSGPAERMWLRKGDSTAPAGRPAGVRLLPYFDAYVIGCHPRGRVFPGAAADRALTRGQAGTVPVVLSGGAVAGVWRHERSGRRLRITVELLRNLTSSQLADLAAEAERTGEIMGGTTELVYGAVANTRHL